MSKLRRKVTVDEIATDDRKPSVFERLGPGAARRAYGKYDDSDSDREVFHQKCRHWAQDGTCPYGAKCKFPHGAVAKPKGREDESPEDLRLRVKGRKKKSGDKRTDSDDSMDRQPSRIAGKKDKDGRIKSTIVVRKPGKGSDDSESTGRWSGEELDFKMELELEKKRQQIQRELSRIEAEEHPQNFTIQKRIVSKEYSSSSESEQDKRSRKSRKHSPSKRKDKKRSKSSRSPKMKGQRSPSPRYDSDDVKSKHKKKSKKHRMSEEKSPDTEPRRKLLSPLKFKKSNKMVLSQTNLAFHSEDEEEEPAQRPKLNLHMPRRQGSVSSDDLIQPPVQRIQMPPAEPRSLTPTKKKLPERKPSPEYVKEDRHKTKPKKSHVRSISRSSSRGRSRSFSPGKKSKKHDKHEKKKRKEERKKDVSHDRHAKNRDETPTSDYRVFSPEPVKKKKKEKKKKKVRELSTGREDHERKHKKDKRDRERLRSESPQPTHERYTQKAVTVKHRSLERRKETEDRTRSPAGKGVRDPFQDRRGKSPELPFRATAERSPARAKEQSDPQFARRDREIREVRDPREPREPRDPREFREPREPDQRDRDTRERDRGPRDVSRGHDGDRAEFERGRERDREADEFRRAGREAPPADRVRAVPVPYRGDVPPVPGREYELRRPDRELDILPPPRDPPPDRLERRERFDDPRDPRFVPPPPGAFDDRPLRFPHGERSPFPEPGDRVPYRPDREPERREPIDRRDPPERRDIADRREPDRREPADRREPSDRREPADRREPGDRRDPAFGERRDPGDRYERFPPRFGEAPQRGPRPPFEFDQPPDWDRGRGRAPRGSLRGGPPAPWGPSERGRGGRYDDRNSRRSDWEGRHRPDDYFGPDRRDLPDRRDADRRDDRRDGSKDDASSKDKRDEDKRIEDKDRKDDGKERDESRRKDDTGRDDRSRDGETRDRKKEERNRDPPSSDRKKDESHRDVDSGDRKKEDRSKDGESADRKREDDKIADRDSSRKRPASVEGSTSSPSTKRPRDGSPALSQHSHRSSKRDHDKTAEVETEKKRSRSRSHDGSRSGDSKRRKVEAEDEEKQLLEDDNGLKVDIVGRVDSMIDQNFSDWSDNDSDDDILNQPGELPATQVASDERQRRSPSRTSVSSKHSQKSGKDKPVVDGAEGEKAKKTKSQDGAEDDEFDSISSDDGSLLGAVKPAAVDALEIDWASLVRDERPKLTTGSALRRFKPGSLFARIGISREYAGDNLYNEVLAVCQRHLDETEGEKEESEKPKTETDEDAESQTPQTDSQVQSDTTDSLKAETETTDSTETEDKDKIPVKTEQPKFQFHHDVAMFHSSALSKLKERRTLLSDIGPFRRALCARRDLEIRRQLCKVDKLLDSSHVYPSQELDTDLYKHSIKLFKASRLGGLVPPPATQAPVTVQ